MYSVYHWTMNNTENGNTDYNLSNGNDDNHLTVSVENNIQSSEDTFISQLGNLIM